MFIQSNLLNIENSTRNLNPSSVPKFIELAQKSIGIMNLNLLLDKGLLDTYFETSKGELDITLKEIQSRVRTLLSDVQNVPDYNFRNVFRS